MSSFALTGRKIALWGVILLLCGGLLNQMTATPTTSPQPTAMQRSTVTATPKATARPTATPKPTVRPTATPKPTARPTATPKLAAAAASASAKSYQVRISYTAQCSNYNHVGNEWTKEFSVNGERVYGSKTISLRAGEAVTLETVITEEDKRPDVGSDRTVLTLTEEELKNGTRLTTTVDVRENGGRYSGNVATWTVTYTVTPVK